MPMVSVERFLLSLALLVAIVARAKIVTDLRAIPKGRYSEGGCSGNDQLDDPWIAGAVQSECRAFQRHTQRRRCRIERDGQVGDIDLQANT